MKKERNYMLYIKVIHPLQWDPGADRLCQASLFERLEPIFNLLNFSEIHIVYKYIV